MLERNHAVVHSLDERFGSDEQDMVFEHYVFVRLSAKGRTFTRVSFKFSTFDACYFRGSRFVSCDFTGCRFASSNFHGARFVGCTFDYATFEKTVIADDILETQAPTHDNLRAKFIRSLRVNFQQLGESESVNKAIKLELEATRTYLRQAWSSKKDYHRTKYAHLKRVGMFFRWCGFSVLHFLWGNGESPLRMLISFALLFVFMGMYDAFHAGDPTRVASFWSGFLRAPSVFLGVKTFPQYSDFYVAAVATTRLLSFAALTSILIKRFNRR